MNARLYAEAAPIVNTCLMPRPLSQGVLTEAGAVVVRDGSTFEVLRDIGCGVARADRSRLSSQRQAKTTCENFGVVSAQGQGPEFVTSCRYQRCPDALREDCLKKSGPKVLETGALSYTPGALSGRRRSAPFPAYSIACLQGRSGQETLLNPQLFRMKPKSKGTDHDSASRHQADGHAADATPAPGKA
jgi:hypothetical protein